MASDNELQIVLSLVDNASAELKKITGDVKKDTQDMAKESEKASKTIGEQMKEAGKGIKDFKREVFAATVVIASIISLGKLWAQHNYETKQNLDSVTISMKELGAKIGSILSPAIMGLNNLLKGLNNLLGAVIPYLRDMSNLIATGFTKALGQTTFFFQELTRGKSITQAWGEASKLSGEAAQMTFEQMSDLTKENIPQVDLLKIKIQEMNDVLDKTNIMYQAGAISAQQYYSILTSESVANFQNMQTQMQLNQQLSTQENLMRNNDLLNFQADVQSRIGLLKILQDYHHTAYSAMMDFSGMVVQKISSGMTTALTGIIMGTKKAKDAFLEFGMSMIQSIVEFVIQYGIQMLIAAALSKVIMASTVAQATAISAAWLPAAIYASIATLGAADAAGVAGLASATGAGLAIGAATAAGATAIGVGSEISELGGGETVDLGRIDVKKAGGGWVGLNGPEIALMGERGPEYVIPNHQLGSMGSNRQTYINIEVNNPQVRSDEDIDRLTEEISLKLAREAERL